MDFPKYFISDSDQFKVKNRELISNAYFLNCNLICNLQTQPQKIRTTSSELMFVNKMDRVNESVH